MMKLAGFFSGTGGVELGFEQSGFDTVFANEWDKFAAVTYTANHSSEFLLEDINNIDINTVPKFDVLTGGFPCQAFSIAGYRKGFQDEKGRGNLFFKLAELIEAKQPEVVFLENVKNLVTHDIGNTFKVILKTLEQLGYHTHWKVLNAKEYGNIPQGRERIYIVAFKNIDSYNLFMFPEPIPLKTKLSDLIDFKTKIDSKYYYTKDKYAYMYPMLDEVNTEGVIYQWRRKYVRANKSGVCPTLTANMGTGGHNVPLIKTTHGIRKLTPRECFNLMGFPKKFILPETLSDAQLYKQAGNAVVPPVIKRISDNIKQAITL